MPVPDLGFAVDFFSATITRRDYGATTTDDHGNRVPGASVDSDSVAHVFPTPGDTVQRLPTGHESGASVEIHTTDTYTVADVTAQTRGTVIVWRGREYEVDTEGIRTAGSANSDSFGVYFAQLVRRAVAP